MNTAQTNSLPMAAVPAHSKVVHFVPEQGVCTKEINFVVDNGSLDYVSFAGGCEGNLKAIASMVQGMHVDFILDRFSGITCGSKSTSCVDQLCHALQDYLKNERSK